MLQRHLQNMLQIRAFACCATVADSGEVCAPHPGSVSPYAQHILLQLPRPPNHAAAAPGSWWPQLVEREPAVVQAFVALARHANNIGGKVKVTAFEELGRRAGPALGTCNLLAFPAGESGWPHREEEGVLQ